MDLGEDLNLNLNKSLDNLDKSPVIGEFIVEETFLQRLRSLKETNPA